MNNNLFGPYQIRMSI